MRGSWDVDGASFIDCNRVSQNYSVNRRRKTISVCCDVFFRVQITEDFSFLFLVIIKEVKKKEILCVRRGNSSRRRASNGVSLTHFAFLHFRIEIEWISSFFGFHQKKEKHNRQFHGDDSRELSTLNSRLPSVGLTLTFPSFVFIITDRADGFHYKSRVCRQPLNRAIRALSI